MHSMWTYPIMFLSIRSETGSRTDAWSWNGPFRTVWPTPARPMWPRIWCITRICTVSVPLRIPGTIPRSRRPQHLTAWAFTTVPCLWKALYQYSTLQSRPVHPSNPSMMSPYHHSQYYNTQWEEAGNKTFISACLHLCFCEYRVKCNIKCDLFYRFDELLFKYVCKSWESSILFHVYVFKRSV